jgi:signal transduction histidine kinase
MCASLETSASAHPDAARDLLGIVRHHAPGGGSVQIVGEATSAARVDAASHSGHILIVEGDQGIARTLAAVLQRQGYAVRTAATAFEAARLLDEDDFDLALIALRDEDADGASLARLHALRPHLTLIVMTHMATFDSALRALRDGAFDYLVKPVDVEELGLRVARALERDRLQRELASRLRELEAAHREAQTFAARLQQRVEHATEELRRKVKELDDVNAHLQQSQAEHDRFVAMVAHEMRGPLNPIINYAQLAKRPGLPREALEQYADIIVEHAFRLNRLVEDLLTATRLTTGHFALRRQPADVAAAVAELVSEFSATVRDRRFTLERPDGPVLADVDLDRVGQAVRNLIDNAVKYSTEGGAVEVSVRQDAERVYVCVRDYGAGIPEEQIQEIFKPFTRLGRTPDVSGSGLGLFITRGIAAAHGGELTVSNGAGAERALGAVFTLALPLHAPPGAPAEVAS